MDMDVLQLDANASTHLKLDPLYNFSTIQKLY